MSESNPLLNTPAVHSLQDVMREACTRFAPSWPLDRAIAVNPWWEMRSQTFPQVAAKLSILGSINCLMPADYYKQHWGSSILSEHLGYAKSELVIDATEDQLLAALDTSATARPWLNFVDYLDAMPEQRSKMAWHAEVQQQISQFCGAFFQYPERMGGETSQRQSLFHSWREVMGLDKGIGIVMGARQITQLVQLLPQSVPEAYVAFQEEVLEGQVDPSACADYATSLLLDVNGWTSWLAYQVWQDNLVGNDNDLIEQLLAIRLSWELLLWRHLQISSAADYDLIKRQFLAQFGRLESRYEKAMHNQQLLWVWHRALEYSYQVSLTQKLLEASPSQTGAPTLQAAFCIDVRSEPMRRAL